MKVHDKKKHTSVDNVKFPKKCDLCDEEIKTAMEMKRHMKRHSYKEAKFKCDDCDFVGESELTMEVHIGKHHSESMNVVSVMWRLRIWKIWKSILFLVKCTNVLDATLSLKVSRM